MSLYGSKAQIDGLSCGLVMRGAANGQYLVVFEREFASLEQIEAISWNQPAIEGECLLPAGYGFTVVDIQYSAATRSYTVILETANQYLGDVAGFQAQVDELEGTVAQQATVIQEQGAMIQDQAETIQNLEQTDGAVALKAALMAAYEEGVESNG